MKYTTFIFLLLASLAWAQPAINRGSAVSSSSVSPGGGGAVSSVNGLTGAVTVKPLTTYAAFVSNAVTLGHDGIVYQGSPVATVPLTLSSGGSAGDERSYEFYFDTAQTVTTDFAVYRNWATTSANISKSYVGKVTIVIRNMGSGEYRWYDNDFTAEDVPVLGTRTNFTPISSTSQAHFEALDTRIGVLAGDIASSVGDAVGTIKLWTTSDFANRPANWLACDGTNGTPTIPDTGPASYMIKGNGTVATPTVDIPAGSYVGSQSVTASNATSGATMRYTLNGVDPTTSDTTVSGPITVASSATLKIKGWKNLYAASSVFSAAYTITSADLISEFFEGAGNPGGAWVTGGTVTFDYSTSPLQGAESMQFTSAFASAYKDIGAGYTDVWGFFIALCPSTNGDNFTITDSAGSTLAAIDFRSDRVNISHTGSTGGSLSSLGGSITSASAVWWHYKASTGASDGTFDVYINKNSTSLIRPAVSIYSTGSNNTSQVRRIKFGNPNTASPGTFDSVIVRTTSIGSTPY